MKTMKTTKTKKTEIIKLLAFSAILFAFYNLNNKTTQLIKHQKSMKLSKNTIAEINWVDMDIQTFIPVPCSSFEQYFKEQYQTKILNDRFISEWEKFKENIYKTEPVNQQVDTRFKIRIKENDIIRDNICGNRFWISINGITYKMPPELIRWINKYIDYYWDDFK